MAGACASVRDVRGWVHDGTCGARVGGDLAAPRNERENGDVPWPVSRSIFLCPRPFAFHGTADQSHLTMQAPDLRHPAPHSSLRPGPAAGGCAGDSDDDADADGHHSTSSSSSSDDRRAYGVRQALPLSAASDSEYEVDDEALAAAAYLAAVRAEAAGVRHARASVPRTPTLTPGAAAGAAPTPTPSPSAADAVGPGDPWLLPFLDGFSATRAAVAERRDIVAGCQVEGPVLPPLSLPADAASWGAAFAGPPPPGLADRLAQPALVEVLERLAGAAGAPPAPAAPGWRGAGAGGGGGAASPTTAGHAPPPTPLPGHTPAWAFSLAAGLERPLTPGAGAALRSLGRAAGAAAARARAAGATDALAAAAVVAAVAGAYFAQDEALCVVAREGWA